MQECDGCTDCKISYHSLLKMGKMPDAAASGIFDGAKDRQATNKFLKKTSRLEFFYKFFNLILSFLKLI